MWHILRFTEYIHCSLLRTYPNMPKDNIDNSFENDSYTLHLNNIHYAQYSFENYSYTLH